MAREGIWPWLTLYGVIMLVLASPSNDETAIWLLYLLHLGGAVAIFAHRLEEVATPCHALVYHLNLIK